MTLRPPQHLDEHRAAFVREVPRGAQVWEALSRIGRAVTHAARAQGDRAAGVWLLHLSLSDALRLRFDLAPALLVCVSPGEGVSAEAIDQVEAELTRARDLDRAVVLVLSMGKEVERHLAPVLPGERTYLFVEFDDLLAASDPQRWAVDRLARELSAARPFTPGAPVADAQFFGRRTELQALEHRLFQKSTPVALVGLRKVGKTSLLQRLRREAEEDADEHGPSVLVVHCDVQAVPFSRRNLDGLLRALWRSACALAGRWPSLASADPSLTRGSVDDADLARVATDALEGLVTWCESRGRKLVVALDEYERLLDGRSVPVDDGLDLLDFLRGLNQQHPKAFNFVFAGLSRRLANAHRFGGRQNPLFAAHHPFPLAGLAREEVEGMVRTLGHRASLEFHVLAIERIADESGGHPFLARTLADLIDQRSPRSRSRVVPVGVDAVDAVLPTFESEVEFVMREVADAVQELGGPGSLTAVVDALEGDARSHLASGFADDLRRYGLLEGEGARARIGVFARWLHRNVSPSPRAAHG